MPDRPSTPAHRDRLAPLRYLYRVPCVLGLVLFAIPLCALVIGPGRKAVQRGEHEPLAHRATRWWSRMLVWGFSFRVRRVGEPLPGAAMFVCNHSSWLDIAMVHTQRAACFVAKAEISRWPLVGWFAACAGTIFHQRGSTASLNQVMDVMVERMRAGRIVAVFPEGGTSHGAELRVFHPRIFQAALDADVPVQPVALRYMRGKERWLDAGFRPKENLLSNALRLMGAAGCVAEVRFLPVVPPNPAGRRHMADQAREEVAKALADDADGALPQ